MNINNVEVSILVGEKPVKLYGHNGKTFICANYGSEYSVKIKNNNHYRVMVVTSVDGIDVLNGKPADKNGVGYVVDAYGSAIIKGFRKDNDTVGAFRFTKKKKGYAKEVTGSSENSGIIALAVFAEKVYCNWTTTMLYNNVLSERNNYASDIVGRPFATFTCQGQAANSCSTADSLTNAEFENEKPRGKDDTVASVNYYCDSTTFMKCSSSINDGIIGAGNARGILRGASKKEEVPDFSVSTNWGTKLTDSVTTTSFEKASSIPLAEFNIYYDIRQNLEKIGIDFQPKKQVSYPKAFPQGFATSPKGWQSS